MNTITLTTDFGTRDWFAGTMKGVIATVSPQASVVDITHGIPPGDIRAGAFALLASYRYFPKGTVHVAVVDSGVGSKRAAIAVETAKYVFVGPDNGVLSWALAHEKIKSVRRLENEALFLQPVSRTFHGRDIFSPVAARIGQGLAFAKLGSKADEFIQLPWPIPAVHKNAIHGEIVYLDHFGNAITNVTSDILNAFDQKHVSVWIKAKRLCALAEFYQSAPNGQPVAILGSSGFLEIAVNGGSAAQKYRLKTGDSVTVQ